MRYPSIVNQIKELVGQIKQLALVVGAGSLIRGLPVLLLYFTGAMATNLIAFYFLFVFSRDYLVKEWRIGEGVADFLILISVLVILGIPLMMWVERKKERKKEEEARYLAKRIGLKFIGDGGPGVRFPGSEDGRAIHLIRGMKEDIEIVIFDWWQWEIVAEGDPGGSKYTKVVTFRSRLTSISFTNFENLFRNKNDVSIRNFGDTLYLIYDNSYLATDRVLADISKVVQLLEEEVKHSSNSKGSGSDKNKSNTRSRKL